MHERTVRVLLAALAGNALSLGAWATFAPSNFYDSFPGGGRAWVSVDGPYNQHLITDFGALNLALGVLAICAAYWLTRPLVIACGLAFITYAGPHVVYHLANLDPYSASDKLGVIGGLLIAPALAVAAIVLSLPWATAAKSGPHPAS